MSINTPTTLRNRLSRQSIESANDDFPDEMPAYKPSRSAELQLRAKKQYAEIVLLRMSAEILATIVGRCLSHGKPTKPEIAVYWSAKRIVDDLRNGEPKPHDVERVWAVYGRLFPDEIVTREQWNAVRKYVAPIVLKRDNHQCVYCGSSENLTIDHRTPISRGGGHGLDNLAACCGVCNSRKGDMTAEEWEAVRDGSK